MSRLLISNARVVNEGEIREADVHIIDGRIARIDAQIQAESGDQVIDAAGKYLLPGMIDDQVHFREPGLTRKGEIATESAAAIAGGITSYMEMPNVDPPTTNRPALAAKYARAAEVSRANYAFYFGGTNDNLDEIRRLEVDEACGVKVFMGSSTGNMLVDDETTLDGIFRDSPTLVATHCEHSPTVDANFAHAQERYGDYIPVEMHPKIRSEEACYRSSSLAVGLAKRHDARLHVLHLTTAREMELFTPGPIAGKRITAEACVHHLYFDDRDYATRRNFIKCNPAIKTPADREALLQALIDDRIDVIATDHAPHLRAEKEQNYIRAPAGLPLVQHALLSVLEHWRSGRFSLEMIAHKTAHAVAECYQVKERGYIREGYWADLVLVDPDKTTLARDEDVLYKCGWTPFSGIEFSCSIDTVLLNGQLAAQHGRVADSIRGQRLHFGRQR